MEQIIIKVKLIKKSNASKNFIIYFYLILNKKSKKLYRNTD